jgi:hypothetical protein
VIRHLLIVCLGMLAITFAIIDIAGPGRSGQIIVSSAGVLMGLCGVLFLVAGKGGFSIIRVLEILIFAVAVVLGLISIAESTKLF